MPFTKGHKINVGREMPVEEREKHSISMRGERNHRFGVKPWNFNKICPQISNEKNGCWKGDSATYTAKHIWIKVKMGKAFMCFNHDCCGVSNTFQWANISHEYKRDEDDWLMLCVRCHAKFDGRTKCQ